MARVAIAINTLGPNGGGLNDTTFTAGDATNDHEFDNDGNTLLVVRNTDVAAKTVTVKSVADPFGRSQDLTLTVPALSGANPGLAMAGPFLSAIWNQSGAKVHVDIASATNLSFAAVKQSISR